MAATGQEKIRSGFGPLMGGFKHLPFNDVSELINGVSDKTAAILIEPIQGEGELMSLLQNFYLQYRRFVELETSCCFLMRFNAGLVVVVIYADGEMISNDPEIKPDAISWAKGLGGGFPIGAIWIRDKSVNDLTAL